MFWVLRQLLSYIYIACLCLPPLPLLLSMLLHGSQTQSVVDTTIQSDTRKVVLHNQ